MSCRHDRCRLSAYATLSSCVPAGSNTTTSTQHSQVHNRNRKLLVDLVDQGEGPGWVLVTDQGAFDRAVARVMERLRVDNGNEGPYIRSAQHRDRAISGRCQHKNGNLLDGKTCVDLAEELYLDRVKGSYRWK